MKKETNKHNVLVIQNEDSPFDYYEEVVNISDYPFEYTIVYSIKDAFEKLKNQKPHIIVTQYQLTDGTAKELLDYSKSIPIIILVRKELEESAVKAIKSGAYEYIVLDQEKRYIYHLHLALERAISNKKLKQELKELRNNIIPEETTNENIKSVYKDLEEKSQEIEFIINTLSHDLRSPLILIGGYSSLIEKKYKDKMGEDGKKYLDVIQANVHHMESLITSLLELSRIKYVDDAIEKIKIEDLIKQVCELKGLHIDDSNIEFNIDGPFPTVYGEINRIFQVFDNLISNAIKYMGIQDKPLIEIGLKDKRDGYAIFYIKDNGIGIAEDYHDSIFQEFFRVKDIKVKGTGIGLAIVKKIIEKHGGSIYVASKIEKGSTFYFSLPIDKSFK